MPFERAGSCGFKESCTRWWCTFVPYRVLKIQDGECTPSWIFFKFLTAMHFRDTLCIIMPNFVDRSYYCGDRGAYCTFSSISSEMKNSPDFVRVRDSWIKFCNFAILHNFVHFCTPCPKKADTKLMVVTLSNLYRFLKFFHWQILYILALHHIARSSGFAAAHMTVSVFHADCFTHFVNTAISRTRYFHTVVRQHTQRYGGICNNDFIVNFLDNLPVKNSKISYVS